MIEHLSNEWPRYVGLLEMGVLISCFIGIHAGSRAVLPRVTYLAGWGILYVFIVLAAVLVINVTSPEPPTRGLIVGVIALTPVAVGGIIAVIAAARQNNRDRQP